MELKGNEKKLFEMCMDRMHAPVKLHIDGGQVLWDRYVEDLMDWLEAEEARGHLELERVPCDETNRGFTFEAVSRDGTRWKSAPVDCHGFASGSVVGRFPDKSGRLVLAIRR
jgi:hypothetical protein